ncbi:uncharacterized protein [Apostichopus japonicus]|uniref:uncharacterized protein isoform X3 n=1 Tax=Stichopus japonicus TaxID=307972 RepID=UPI003AB1843A
MFANFDVTPRFLFTVLLAFNNLQPSKTQGCSASPCQYGGTCENNICSCPPGLTGPTCSNVDCSDYPCFNRGTCMPGPPDMCICPPDTVQPFCTISCLIEPCVNGTCVGDVCNCDTNFAGPTCESAIAAYLSPREITLTEGHAGQKAVTVQVCRQPSSEEVTLQVYTFTVSAFTDVDFVNIPFNPGQDVTISAGQTCTPVNVFIISDFNQETMSKDLFLVLFDPQPSSSMVHFVPGHIFTTITITDDDPDIEPPTIDNCPDDITVTAPAGAAATTVSWTPPTATDLSGAVTLTSSQNPGDSFTIGSTQVNYTANDGANNFASCGFTVTVVDVNECLLQTDNCDDASTTCQDTNEGFTCNCLPGFSRVTSTTCEDMNECLLQTDNCDDASTTCQNTNGGFTCNCLPGFSRQTSTTCQDMNECLLQTDNCDDASSTCQNTNGGFICNCLQGFSRVNPTTCQDLNECLLQTDNCDDASTTCQNTNGGFNCNCLPGFSRLTSTTCQDMNECLLQTDNCDDASTTCQNTNGGFTCNCLPGFSRQTSTTCQDMNECLLQTDNCDDASTTCQNTNGGFTCNCLPGFSRQTSTTCQDMNECLLQTDNCDDASTTCQNTNGGFTCNCLPGFSRQTSTTCQDMNECLLQTDNCDDASTTCQNTNGGFTCNCLPGFSRQTSTTCQDMNECLLQTDNCDDASTTCQNTNGGFTCNCLPGFSRQTSTTCQDMNECLLQTDNCDDASSTCQNTNGGFICNCLQGFSRVNPTTCQDLNECLLQTDNCDDASTTCQNTNGGFNCNCLPGFSRLTSTTCQADDDECASLGTNMCDSSSSTCMNIIGSYICMCKSGYTGLPYTPPGQQPTCTADVTPPVISGCPRDIFPTVQIGAQNGFAIWTEPTATDNSGTATLVSQSHPPGSSFLVGRTTVTYKFADPAGNEAVCTFDVIVQGDCISLNSAGQCNSNECSCTKGTCTSQTGRCEATCSVFQCPANIASESLSQVNPQSSVEIKCILEGSDAVVNRLDIRLSRLEGAIDDQGITQDTEPDISANRREVTDRVISVSEDDQFFCFLSLGASIVGSINVTGFVYKIPSISDPPTQLTRTTTSVTITWRPWDEETDVGDPPVVAYIPYYKMDPSQDWMNGSRIQADQTLQYTASSLESDRNYTFSVATVREGEGGEGLRSPAVTIKTLCIDVVPQMVRTTVTATNDVTVTWQQPTVQCSTGITQFTIYYELEGDVSSRQEAGTADPNAESFTVDGSLLEPGTTYNIAVTVTTDQESALSEGSFLTKSEPPSSPPVYLVALVIPVLLIIILSVVIIKRIRRKPASEAKPVDVQDVDYVNAGVTDDPGEYIALEERSRNTPAPKYQDLTEKAAPTQVSGYEITILETADAAPKAMPRQGIKRQTDYQYEDVNLGETDARKLPSVPQPDLQSEDDTEYEVPEMFEEYTGVYIGTIGASKPITPRPLKITEYKTFMGRERSKVISEIVQQYTALKPGQQHPWTAAVKLQNKPKNFFKALLPYDHSRVRLDTDGSDVRSDYINASYIKNHQGKVSFIAAQGPREGTKDDFWRMVWKEDVETIVTLVDKDGTEQHSKDAQYWPNKVNTSQKYGAIRVLLIETTTSRSYSLREMNVIKGNEKVLTVRQYEIPCWKYGGVPSEPADLISVIKQIKNHQKGGKHLLVHCSNGVGATGVFISLYDLMDVIKTKKEVSVFDVIEGMRKDRVNMVLTKLQYLFIFDALLEAMSSPDSQMSCDQLKKLDPSVMKAKCKKEFQILQETTKHQEDLATLAGNSSANNHKNRFPDILPVDKFRPVLKSPGKLFGSNDYINATFAKDISQRGFIMTQSPLATTVEDFWRLVFDYDCTSIVMLNTVDDSDESLTVYWPNGNNAAASNGLMTVICKKIEESDVFTRRQFAVKHKRSQKSLLVDHFSFHGWLGNKPDVHKLREFIKFTRTKGTGPAIVHCINGVGLSAVYVTVISELERIDKEGTVDVFQTLKKLRKQCPKAVQTQDEYLLCYEHLRDHLNNPDEYTVIF